MKNKLPFADRLTKEQWLLLAILTAGIILRVIYIVQFSRHAHFDCAVGPDVMEYHERAVECLTGKFFPETPDIHAPLYSWFLAIIYFFSGTSVVFARCVQLVINLAAYFSMTLLIRRLGASFKMQACFLAAAMLTPVIFFHQAELVSESLLAPFSALFFWLILLAKEKRRLYFFAGCSLGLLVMTHALMTAFAFAELLWFLCRRRFKEAAAVAAGVCVAVLPIIAAKSVYYGKFCGVQANSAFNLWIGSNPNASGGCYLRAGKQWRTPLENARRDAAERGISENMIFLEKIGRFYLDDPKQILLMPLKKTALLISPSEPVAGADPEAIIRSTLVQKAGMGMFGAVLAGAFFGIYFVIRKKETAYIHFYLLATSLSAALLISVVAGRYRQGMMPSIILLCAVGLTYLGRKALLISLCGMIAGWFCVDQKLASPDPEYDAITGEAYFRKGDFAAAEKYLTEAEKHIDDPARFNNMLGIIAEKKGDFAAAENHYQKVIAEDPEFPDAWLNLAHLYFVNFPEKRRDALMLIAESLHRDSRQASAYDMLGQHYAATGDLQKALEMFSYAVECDPAKELYRQKVEACRNIMERKENAH